MRGNHVILGRQDYTEPPPLPPEALARIGMCAILPRSPDRVKPLCWHDVFVGDTRIGMVATRIAGQCCWLPGEDDSFVVARDWSRADPLHAHAVLHLLDAAEIDAGVPA